MTHFILKLRFLNFVTIIQKNYLSYITLFLGLILMNVGFSQERDISISKEVDNRCGLTEEIRVYEQEYPQEHERKLKAFEDRMESNRLILRNSRSIEGVCPNGITVIPVAIHIFHDPANAVGQGYNFSLAQMKEAIHQLNADFAGLNLNKYKITNEFQRVDPGHSCIQFVIGKINRIDRTSCSFWSDTAVFYDLHNCLPGGSGIGSANDPTKYLNIYLNEINSGLLGQASCIPPVFGACNTDYDGVVLNSKIFVPYQGDPIYDSNNEGSVLSHEVGHWLGLPHVDGDIAGAQCTGDDGFNDTNSQAYKTRYSCSGTISKTCSTTDNVFNYMDYAQDCATSMFTKEQRQAMETTMNTERFDLKSSYANGNYVNNWYSVECSANLANPTLTSTIDIDCYGSVNLLNFLQSWYPSAYDNYNVTNGLQTFSWSKKGLNGAYINSYVDIADVDFVHTSQQPTDTTLLTLTMDCWDPISESYVGGVAAGTVLVVTHNCGATNNDLCSSAISIEPKSICVVDEYPYYNVQSESSVLSCGLPGTDRDLWFTTTVPFSGKLSIETIEIVGELEDMTMEVYSGSCSGLTLIDCNDDFGGSLHSKILLDNLTPNQPLFIRISESEGDEEGLFGLCIVELISNDDCVDAIAIPVNSTCVNKEYSLVNATPSDMPTESACAYLGPANDIWFSFIVPSSGNVIIEVSDSEDQPIFDSVTEVYRGNCGDLEQIGCNNRSNTEELLNFLAMTDLLAGEEIFIRVNAYGGYSEGRFNLCVYESTTSFCSLNFVEIAGQSLCDPVSNSYSQDVIVHYNNNGTATNLNVANQYFEITTSPQLVTLENLPANGSYNNIFVDVYNCDDGVYFTNSLRYMAPENCYSGVVSNDECQGAIMLDINSSCTSTIFDNIGATTSPDVYYCSYAGNNPQDVWFSFIVPSSGDVIVNAWRTSTVYPIFEVYEGDCDNLVKVAECGSDWRSIRLSGQTPGDQLFFHVAAESGSAQGEFGVCVFEPEPFTNDICSTATQLEINTTCNNLIYSDHFSNAEMGSISCDGSGNNSYDLWFHLQIPPSGNVSIIIEEAEFGFNNFLTEVYSGDCNNLNYIDCFNDDNFSISGDAVNTDVWLRIADYGSYDFHAFSICALAIENDICSEAISVGVGTCGVYNNEGASPSDNPQAGLLCGNNGVGNDLWFQTIVPSSGNITIETNEIDSDLRDLNMEVYIGTCSNLDPIACSVLKDSDTNDYQARIELEGLNPNDVIYIRIIENYSNDIGDFELCIFDQGYTYPCRILLIEPSTASACDPVTNSYDQTLIVHYITDGSATEMYINNKFFALTGSPQTIVIEDLPANGNPYSVDGRMYVNGNYGSCTSQSYYYSSALSTTPPNCFSGIIANDICADAINLSVGQACESNIFDNTGATSSGRNICGGGNYPQDLWFTVVVPPSGEIVINTWYDSNVSSTFDIYYGDCDNLNYLESCGREYRSKRLKNRAPGELLFIQVADRNSDDQGSFGICAFEPQEFTNDVCQDAIEIPITSECSSLIYSTHFAIAESDAIECDGSNNPSEDMWFKVKIPNSGEVTLNTNEVERGYSDILMEAYIGTCTSSFNICDSYSGSNGHPYLNLTGLIPGSYIYVRIAGYGGYNGESFNMCATTSCPDIDYINTNFNNVVHKKAAESIIADNLIHPSASVIYDAPQSIELYSGFEVASGATFETYLIGCN